MKNVLCIGDPHFKVSNLEDCYAFIQKIDEILLANKLDGVVILGDLHNDFEKIHALVLKAITQLFRVITQKHGVELFYVVGNHDMINNRVFCEDSHVFNPFKLSEKIHIIDTPIELNGVIFVPYVEPGRFAEAYQQFGTPRAVMCHQEFNGVQLGPKPSTSPDKWAANKPVLISGHIHNYHWLQDNLCYLGVPFDHEYTNEPVKRYVAIVDLDSPKDLKLIELGLPSRVTMTMTAQELLKFPGAPLNTHLRVYVTCTSEELHSLKKVKKYQEMCKIYKVIPKVTDKVQVGVPTATGRQTYMGILSEAIKSETPAVQSAFDEVYRAATQTK